MNNDSVAANEVADYGTEQDGMWFWAIAKGRKVGRSTSETIAMKIARDVAVLGYTEMESNV